MIIKKQLTFGKRTLCQFTKSSLVTTLGQLQFCPTSLARTRPLRLEALSEVSSTRMYYREAQGLQERLLGHHQDTARSCVQLSDVLVLQGQFDEAWEELYKAFEIQKDILGPDHKITKDTVRKMSDVMDKRGSNPR